MPKAHYFKPELNKPYTLALKYPVPTRVKSFNGGWDLKFILLDGMALYLPERVGQQVVALKIPPGTAFHLKRSDNNHWDVSHVPDSLAGQRLPSKAAALIEQAGALDAPHGMGETNPQPIPKGPATALERALNTAVTAAAEAERHGQAIGYNVRFTPADVRALGITVYIGQQSGRAA